MHSASWTSSKTFKTNSHCPSSSCLSSSGSRVFIDHPGEILIMAPKPDLHETMTRVNLGTAAKGTHLQSLGLWALLMGQQTCYYFATVEFEPGTIRSHALRLSLLSLTRPLLGWDGITRNIQTLTHCL